jgi:hypothetical protein
MTGIVDEFKVRARRLRARQVWPRLRDDHTARIARSDAAAHFAQISAM